MLFVPGVATDDDMWCFDAIDVFYIYSLSLF